MAKAAKKAAPKKAVVKKAAPKKAAPVAKKAAPKKEVEEAPTVPGKLSFGQRLWGNK